MKIIITKHAQQRLEERDIPNPNLLSLKHASRRVRKNIRASCRKEGCDTRKAVYFMSNKMQFFDNKFIEMVYVCKVTENIGEFVLITALKYE